MKPGREGGGGRRGVGGVGEGKYGADTPGDALVPQLLAMGFSLGHFGVFS